MTPTTPSDDSCSTCSRWSPSTEPKLKPNQIKHLLLLYDEGTYNQTELADLFSVSRTTVYRTIEHAKLASTSTH
jgi:DNA-binding MarR family transcriptional regulator